MLTRKRGTLSSLAKCGCPLGFSQIWVLPLPPTKKKITLMIWEWSLSWDHADSNIVKIHGHALLSFYMFIWNTGPPKRQGTVNISRFSFTTTSFPGSIVLFMNEWLVWVSFLKICLFLSTLKRSVMPGNHLRERLIDIHEGNVRHNL